MIKIANKSIVYFGVLVILLVLIVPAKAFLNIERLIPITKSDGRASEENLAPSGEKDSGDEEPYSRTDLEIGKERPSYKEGRRSSYEKERKDFSEVYGFLDLDNTVKDKLSTMKLGISNIKILNKIFTEFYDLKDMKDVVLGRGWGTVYNDFIEGVTFSKLYAGNGKRYFLVEIYMSGTPESSSFVYITNKNEVYTVGGLGFIFDDFDEAMTFYNFIETDIVEADISFSASKCNIIEIGNIDKAYCDIDMRDGSEDFVMISNERW